jgi:selenocysteine-specific elongation factor
VTAEDPRRRVPRTDLVLADPRLVAAAARLGDGVVRTTVQSAQARARAGELSPKDVADAAVQALPQQATTLRPVLNATGVVLHTNLGRAPLSDAAREALLAASGAVDVEFDVDTGARARRGRGTLDALLLAVPDAQAALVVNNGAAALVLATTALAAGREVVVSRGEMVEIGDGFRLPDLIASTGARLREVGTTNRTTLRDYADAVGPDTGCILKVHPSNFRVEGFTSSVDVAELAGLDAPVVADVGSGLLAPDRLLPDEPDVRTALRAGAAVVTCSGDKLLGGPQAGLLLGRSDVVETLRRHPLARALRADKLALAALEATLRGSGCRPCGRRCAWTRLRTARAASTSRGEVGGDVVAADGAVGGGGARGGAARRRGRAARRPAGGRLGRRVAHGRPVRGRPGGEGPVPARPAVRAAGGRRARHRRRAGGPVARVHVVATAGHVDHGKSTLVRALTGTDPDRWAEEQRRGMTIDLGHAASVLPSGAELAFVDVPGHARFIGNMLAGLGPAPAVLVVVAADEGWRRQSGEHLAAASALGLRHGLLAVTRSDLADPGPAIQQALAQLAGSTLQGVEAVAVSGTTGLGLDELRAALDRLVSRLSPPDVDADVRLWVDRSFSIRGSGTVVTGTLGSGSLSVGGALEIGGRTVRVRGLQRLGRDAERVSAVARVAVNLRGVDRDDVGRGDALLTPGVWRVVDRLDVRLSTDPRALPAELVLHVGTAAVPVRLRPLADDTARLALTRSLPLRAGDRALLRDPAAQLVAAGVLVLDADPPELSRRGAAAARGADLQQAGAAPDLRTEVARRGAVRRDDLVSLGVAVHDPPGVREIAGWLVDDATWRRWQEGLRDVVVAHERDHPVDRGLPHEVARRAAGVPDARLLTALIDALGLVSAGGRLRPADAGDDLGAAEVGVQALEQRLAASPFDAPERPDLEALRLGAREVAAAAAAGRVLRLTASDGAELVLLPDAPARAMRVLAALPQPFTLSAARQALGTTRRVAVPLLEHLDRRGWTRRVDGATREVVR